MLFFMTTFEAIGRNGRLQAVRGERSGSSSAAFGLVLAGAGRTGCCCGKGKWLRLRHRARALLLSRVIGTPRTGRTRTGSTARAS